ncbi:MAG: hypothetical protein ACRBBO_15470 [Cognatishimia sp.]
MSLAGRLMATLGLDSRGFKKGLNESEGLAKRFGRSLIRVGATAAAAFTGIAASVGRAAGVLTDLDNQAKVAGETAERLKILSLATAGYGVDQEKLADILKDVNDKLGDFAATGEGPLTDFFENIAPKVGVTLKSFEDLSSSDALQLYVASLEKAGVSQQEMTFYMEALASDATALLPVFANQGAALDVVTAKAKALGLAIDQETVDAARKARGEFALVSEVLSTRLQVALASLIPYLVAFLNVFAAVGQAIAPYFARVVAIAGVLATVFGVRLAAAIGVRYVAAARAAVAQAIALEVALGAKSKKAAVAGLAVKGLSRALRVLRAALIATGIGALVVAAGELVFWFGRLVSSTGSFGGALGRVFDLGKAVFNGIGLTAQGLFNIMSGVAKSIQASYVRAFSEIAKAWDALVNGMASAWNSIAESSLGETLGLGLLDKSNVSGELKDKSDALFDEAIASIHKGGGLIKDAGKGIVEVLRSIRDEIAEVEGEAEDGSVALSRMDKLLSGLGNGGDASGGSGKSIKDKLAPHLKYLNDRIKNFSDGIAGAIVQGKSLGAAARQVFQRMAQDFISSGIQKLISNLFNIGGSSGGGGGGWFGKLFGAFFGVPKNARGTGFHHGGYTQIFEEGGEIVDLPTGTRIIPHDLSKRMMDAAGQGAARLASGAVAAGGRQEVAVVLSQTSLRLTDDGKIVGEIEARTDRKIAGGMSEIDRTMPDRMAKYDSDRRVRN